MVLKVTCFPLAGGYCIAQDRPFLISLFPSLAIYFPCTAALTQLAYQRLKWLQFAQLQNLAFQLLNNLSVITKDAAAFGTL